MSEALDFHAENYAQCQCLFKRFKLRWFSMREDSTIFLLKPQPDLNVWSAYFSVLAMVLFADVMKYCETVLGVFYGPFIFIWSAIQISSCLAYLYRYRRLQSWHGNLHIPGLLFFGRIWWTLTIFLCMVLECCRRCSFGLWGVSYLNIVCHTHENAGCRTRHLICKGNFGDTPFESESHSNYPSFPTSTTILFFSTSKTPLSAAILPQMMEASVKWIWSTHSIPKANFKMSSWFDTIALKGVSLSRRWIESPWTRQNKNLIGGTGP